MTLTWTDLLTDRSVGLMMYSGQEYLLGLAKVGCVAVGTQLWTGLQPHMPTASLPSAESETAESLAEGAVGGAVGYLSMGWALPGAQAGRYL